MGTLYNKVKDTNSAWNLKLDTGYDFNSSEE